MTRIVESSCPQADRFRSPEQSTRNDNLKENVTMKKLGYFAVCAMLTMGICVAQDLVNIILGTIKKVDSNTKTIVVETADGTEHTIKVTDTATVKGTKDGFNGLRERTLIVARTTGKGTDETAMEVGKISEDGFKATDGTVKKFDKDARTIVVNDVHGAKRKFELGGKALEDAGKAAGAGIAKGTIVRCITRKKAERK